jgi:hypothetical protein
MTQLWYMVIPMFRCWNVLLPLKLTAGFNVVVALLEKRVLAPLWIEATQYPWRRVSASDAARFDRSTTDVAPDVAVGVG